jgi:hypothetical protein
MSSSWIILKVERADPGGIFRRKFGSCCGDTTVATHTCTGKHCMRYLSNEYLFDEAADYVVDF